MVKSLLEMCLNLLYKPCEQTAIDKYWLNRGLRCIPFKFGQKVQSTEFFHCICRQRLFKVTFLERNIESGVSPRARNCFHCWFVFLMEIKLKKLYKDKNNLIRFTSLLIDFFSFINKFKYIYVQPDHTNVKYFDLRCESFHYYLSENDSCLCCCCSESGPFLAY